MVAHALTVRFRIILQYTDCAMVTYMDVAHIFCCRAILIA